MIIKYFSIYDKKAVQFGPVFSSHTPGSAERSFRDAMTNPDAPYGKYPDDFALYEIFEFDDEKGIIVSTHEPPLLLVEGHALVNLQ